MSQFCSEKDYRDRGEVCTLFPGWKVLRVNGGWYVFEFAEDYEQWRKEHGSRKNRVA